MENIEKDLIEYLSTDITIPKNFEDTILHSLDKKVNKKLKFNIKCISYIAALFLIAIILVNTYTLAYKSYKYKSNTSIGFVTESLEQSVENGYIQNVDMDYTYSNGVGVKIDYIIMSDYNLNILFNFDFTNNSKILDSRLTMDDLIIYDEDYNILFCYNPKIYKEFCKLYNLEYFKERPNQSTEGYGIEPLEIYTDIYKPLYKLQSIKGFPNSKKLFISFYSLSDFKEKVVLKGIWNMELDLSEKFYNRTNINYEASNYSTEDRKINLVSAIVSDTIMRVNLDMNKNDYHEAEKIDMYILDENNKRYDINTIEEYLYFYDNSSLAASFPISKINATDKMKLIMTYKDREEVIDLVKSY